MLGPGCPHHNPYIRTAVYIDWAYPRPSLAIWQCQQCDLLATLLAPLCSACTRVVALLGGLNPYGAVLGTVLKFSRTCSLSNHLLDCLCLVHLQVVRLVSAGYSG
eukprot:GHUV01044130.1.p1 GENE.GHUV01044130.1~~GHUV01044130.1.p1  ORF type:complete len:105 (+),score=7.69 GHUV01044130.1:192-506(+)